MKAVDLYSKLDKDFITQEMSDEWARFMREVEAYLCDNFKKRSMGLVCDFAEEIEKVYSIVFPTKEVLQKIIDGGAENAMIFLHHPSIWDIRKTPKFYQMDPPILEILKERRISIYNLHVPLDHYGEYSTSNTLAKALDVEVIKQFGKSRGVLSGVIGKTKCTTLKELNEKFSKVLGHDTKYYSYGGNEIKDGKVAIVAGGGNDLVFLKEMLENDVRVLITGISSDCERYKAVHDFEKENNISLLGGTHYSTEKLACMKMCDYFEKLGLKAEFIEGEAIYEDM